jgi:hypothetical protein
MYRVFLVFLAVFFLLLSFTLTFVFSQEIYYCEGNFDYDQNVDGSDAFIFKTDFGRSIITNNPCPPDGPAPVPKTWQWISYSPGDDGDLENGAMWPNPRFTDNGDETITDNLTGLMWLKDANCIASWYPGFDNDDVPGDGEVEWQHALDFVEGINDGSYSNCGGTQPYTDWRVPNIRELHSLIHYGFLQPAVPCTAGPCQWVEGDPFINLESEWYCSSSTPAGYSSFAWFVNMRDGYVSRAYKEGYYHQVWPVRGGH